jgi:hypothetical protein
LIFEEIIGIIHKVYDRRFLPPFFVTGMPVLEGAEAGLFVS